MPFSIFKEKCYHCGNQNFSKWILANEENVGLFEENVGLFWENVGLFDKIAEAGKSLLQKYFENRNLKMKIKEMFYNF